MKSLFGKDLVELAIKMERYGHAFYDSLAKGAKNEKVKGLFAFLAQEEQKHIKNFESLSQNIGDYRPPGVHSGLDESVLQVMVDMNIFTDSNAWRDAARKAETEAQALNVGIDFEKESLLFYHELKPYVREVDEGIVEAVLKQEKEHLLRLSALKKEMGAV